MDGSDYIQCDDWSDEIVDCDCGIHHYEDNSCYGTWDDGWLNIIIAPFLIVFGIYEAFFWVHKYMFM